MPTLVVEYSFLLYRFIASYCFKLTFHIQQTEMYIDMNDNRRHGYIDAVFHPNSHCRISFAR